MQPLAQSDNAFNLWLLFQRKAVLSESFFKPRYLLSNREIKNHVYGKRQTSDSSWEFLRTKSKQLKPVQNNSYE